jgi:hypothetical protein
LGILGLDALDLDSQIFLGPRWIATECVFLGGRRQQKTAKRCSASGCRSISRQAKNGSVRKLTAIFASLKYLFTQGGYNMDDRYSYTEKKFSEARRVLMLPAPGKEALAISEALQDCQLGLQNIAHLNHDLDERVLGYISRLRELTDKRKSFGDNDKQELCDLINHLAYYFHDRWKQV